jgi:hypothetical protein
MRTERPSFLVLSLPTPASSRLQSPTLSLPLVPAREVPPLCALRATLQGLNEAVHFETGWTTEEQGVL